MSAFSRSVCKALTAAALTAALAASPAAAATGKGSSFQLGWIWQALGWLAQPLGWVSAALEGPEPVPSPSPGPAQPQAGGVPAEGLDQGWSVDPNGQPR